MCYTIRKGIKDLSRRFPVKGTHGEMVVSTFTNSELFSEIIKGIKAVRSIKFFIVFPMRSFDLAVMARSTNTNQLVPDTKLAERLFKKCFSVGSM